MVGIIPIVTFTFSFIGTNGYDGNIMTITGASGAVSIDDGKLYIFGGHDQYHNALTSVEAYDDITNTWTMIDTRMPRARTGHKCVMVYGQQHPLHLVGDDTTTDNNLRSKSSNRSNSTGSNSSQTNNSNACSIWVLGGMLNDGRGALIIDIYTPCNNTWSIAPFPLPRSDSYFGCEFVNGRLIVIRNQRRDSTGIDDFNSHYTLDPFTMDGDGLPLAPLSYATLAGPIAVTAV
jgi:hypothetical protein